LFSKNKEINSRIKKIKIESVTNSQKEQGGTLEHSWTQRVFGYRVLFSVRIQPGLIDRDEVLVVIHTARDDDPKLTEEVYDLVTESDLPALITRSGNVHVFLDVPGVDEGHLRGKIFRIESRMRRELAVSDDRRSVP